MSINLILADCIETMNNMENNAVNLLLTDIPYDSVSRKSNGLRNLDKGIADISTFNLSNFVNEAIRVTSGSGYIFCGWEQISEIVSIIKQNNLSVRLCCWNKTNPSPMNGQYIWLSGVEYAVYFKKRNATFNEHCKNPVFNFSTGKSKLFPTMKSIKLMEYLISVSSNDGDIVFDPCMGSGSTGIAAKNLHRSFIGIEIDEDTYNLAKTLIN